MAETWDTDFPFDLSDWMVVDDVSEDGDHLQKKTTDADGSGSSQKATSSAVKHGDKKLVQTVNKPKNSSIINTSSKTGPSSSDSVKDTVKSASPAKSQESCNKPSVGNKMANAKVSTSSGCSLTPAKTATNGSKTNSAERSASDSKVSSASSLVSTSKTQIVAQKVIPSMSVGTKIQEPSNKGSFESAGSEIKADTKKNESSAKSSVENTSTSTKVPVSAASTSLGKTVTSVMSNNSPKVANSASKNSAVSNSSGTMKSQTKPTAVAQKAAPSVSSNVKGQEMSNKPSFGSTKVAVKIPGDPKNGSSNRTAVGNNAASKVPTTSGSLSASTTATKSITNTACAPSKKDSTVSTVSTSGPQVKPPAGSQKAVPSASPNISASQVNASVEAANTSSSQEAQRVVSSKKEAASLNVTSFSKSTQVQAAENKTSNIVKSTSAPASAKVSVSTAAVSSKETTGLLVGTIRSAQKSGVQKVPLSTSSDASRSKTSAENTEECAVTGEPARTLQGSSTKVTASTSASTSSVSVHKSEISTKETLESGVSSVSKPAKEPSSTNLAAEPLTSAVCSTDKSGLQTSLSQTQIRDKTPSVEKSKVRSIAEVMESVDDRDEDIGGSAFDYDMEEISDTEFPDLADSVKISSSKVDMLKKTCVKREGSPIKEGPDTKKAKIQNSASPSTSTLDQPATVLKKKQNQDIKSEETAAKKGLNQQNQSSTTKETAVKQNDGKSEDLMVKKGVKKQNPAGSISTAGKGSFGAIKTVAAKNKDQLSSTPSGNKTATIAAAFKVTEAEASTDTTPTKAPVKRIIRRFHRMTQTVAKECSNKLVQCLIRIPSQEPPSKSKRSHVAVQTEKSREEVFYKKAPPDTVKPQVLKIVSAFDVNCPANRNIISESFDFGISLGHVTAADVEKSMFRENILTKSAHYSLYFDKRDFGVVDLFFAEEGQFTAALTQIRKMKIGPRHLVVTYCKNLKESELAPGSSVSCVKATVIYDQNFASTSFLTHVKAPIWNKPKVEETVTIHNLPVGIPLDFLKLLIPDAITIELDDDRQKFTLENSCAYLGLNRKSGGDRFLKLFAQMYVNNECLVFTTFTTRASVAHELSEVLKERKRRVEKMKSEFPTRELVTVPRDINELSKTKKDDKVETEAMMQVHDVSEVEKVSAPQTPALKGTSTVGKLQKGQQKPAVSQKINSKDPALSDVSEDLSDISDTSNIGEESTTQKKTQKRGAPTKKRPTTVLKRLVKPSFRTSSARKPVVHRRPEHLNEGKDNKQKKSRSVTSSESRHRKERRDGFADRHHSPSKQTLDRDRSIHRVHENRDVRAENEARERHDRVRKSALYSDQEKNSGRLHRESHRNEGTKREVERYVSGHDRDDFRTRRSVSGSRSERERQRSLGADTRRARVDLEFDRHGRRIVHLAEREEGRVRDRFVEDKLPEQARQNRLDICNDQDDGRKERLDRLVQKRLSSLERQGRQSRERGNREKKLARSRSPNPRRKLRGRSASPKRGHSLLQTANTRQMSPAPSFGTQAKLATVRRPLSHSWRNHGSALSPISVGEDSDYRRENMEGLWLQQPPGASNIGFQQSEESRSHIQTVAGLAQREDVRKASNPALAANNLVAVQREWQPTIQYHRPERQQLEDPVVSSSASGGRKSPSQFVPGVHDPVKFFERIREIYGSGVNFTDTGSGVKASEALHSAEAVRGGQRPAGGYERSRNASGEGEPPARPLHNVPVSTWQGRGPAEPINHPESRFNYDIDRGRTGNPSRFDDIDRGRAGNPTRFDDIDRGRTGNPTRFDDIDRGRAGNPTRFDDHQYNSNNMYGREPRSGPVQPTPEEYHQTQHAPLPPPIPPPLAPPLFTPARALSPEGMSQMEALAQMLTENVHNQGSPNVAQEMWNMHPEGSRMPGPRPQPQPQFTGPTGPYPPMGQQFNMPGPPHLMRPPNFHPSQDVRGPVPHPPPWSQGNYF